MVVFKVVARSGRELVPGGLEVKGSNVDDLINAFHEASKQKKVTGGKVYYPSRQRWTLPAAEGEKQKPVVLDSGKKLSDYGLKEKEVTVVFKDLGPQIGYSTVFFLEYFGPMAIYPLFYFFAPAVYGMPHSPVLAQRLAVAYHTGHYAKRILETFLVHEFSHGTMPIANLFRNCGYYWSFAAFISYFVNHPLYTSPPEERVRAAFAVACACQALNAYSHVVLSKLRSDGSKGYKIPYSLLAGFNFVTCANYMWEILGWAAFNVATQTLAGVVFNVCGAAQMAQWAAAKHARLRREFNGENGKAKYPRRWRMLPPFF